MGLSSEMKNLSEEILTSFKQRIKANEELVNDVQKILDGFRKDHQDMASVLNAKAEALRNGLALGEKERLNNFSELMSGINSTIASIQKEVVAIQTSTFNMINDFTTDRTQMADKLNEFFAQGRTERMLNEKNRIKEFDALMNNINNEIKSINEEVLGIFKNTNDMLDKFEKEHLEMSADLRAELNKNLTERVEYTKILLNGFQERLSEISKENQTIAQKLRTDLANGEAERLDEYKEIMNGIHLAIKEIQKEVNVIQKATAGMLGDFSQDRGLATAEWNKMLDAIAQIRKSGLVVPPNKEAKKVEEVKQTPVEVEPNPAAPMMLQEKVLNYINEHPNGVKISEMEEPLGETRMKLGSTAKALLDEGKVQKNDNIYFPLQ